MVWALDEPSLEQRLTHIGGAPGQRDARVLPTQKTSSDGVAGASFARSSSAEHRDRAETSRIGAADRRRGPQGRGASRGAAREHTAIAN